MTPQPWAFALLALAAFRVWKLLADDAILDRPREWAIRRLPGKFDLFIVCPWCLGAHLSLVWWAAWWAWPHPTLVVASPFALSAAVGLLASALDAFTAKA